MILREFSRSFLSIAVKPKKCGWNMKVIERETQRVLMNDAIDNEAYARPGTLDRNILKWWIEYQTIYVVVE